MSKRESSFVCQNCGYEASRWLGRCPSCGEWNTMVEERTVKKRHPGRQASKDAVKPVTLGQVKADERPRVTTAHPELDRVLGGGLVHGSLILLGGDPGIGKSTLALQLSARLADGMKVLYVSGEESALQLKLRTERLGLSTDELYILTETDAEEIEASVADICPGFLVIDSIQTMTTAALSGAAGSVGQVREVAARFQRLAKRQGITTLIIGHVTKVGTIAGPRTLEHVVDTVLYFEGERFEQYRILRAVKNRFGSTNEIGLFEMTSRGLADIDNPSFIFLTEGAERPAGAAVTVVLEGTRPLVVEVQGLTAPTPFSIPQRVTTGFPHRRFAMLLAVLARRGGVSALNLDTYLNVVGGISIDEPSCDLAVIAAIAGSLSDRKLPSDLVLFGEIGLGGEVRGVAQADVRLKEAGRLGFTQAIVPKRNLKKVKGLEVIPAGTIRDVLEYLEKF
ncbi:DNA repair protein RadA [candidate division WOR-3 bacterium]|uniref:DNA repair protein RadA n=1 Tax=candidate division WOR-3 bacterium TaxID=2052148 RepID=A0A9D5KA22_UNCW3|nr:DNA repair protein RadA [candidate division WOR-3 bacterium]MBD3364914.1 DNA repair protein RadA [candidate division WOR-3 bacterium]